MSNKTRQNRLLAASDVLQSLLQNSKSPLAQQFTRWRLWRYWPEVVGPSMARYTAPVSYDRGRLIVWVSDSVRLQEMTFVVSALQEKINSFVGRKWVHSIRFTLDRHAIPDHNQMNETSREFLSQTGENSSSEDL